MACHRDADYAFCF